MRRLLAQSAEPNAIGCVVSWPCSKGRAMLSWIKFVETAADGNGLERDDQGR